MAVYSTTNVELNTIIVSYGKLYYSFYTTIRQSPILSLCLVFFYSTDMSTVLLYSNTVGIIYGHLRFSKQ